MLHVKLLFTHRCRRQNFHPSLLQQWITVCSLSTRRKRLGRQFWILQRLVNSTLAGTVLSLIKTDPYYVKKVSLYRLRNPFHTFGYSTFIPWTIQPRLFNHRDSRNYLTTDYNQQVKSEGLNISFLKCLGLRSSLCLNKILLKHELFNYWLF